MARLGRSFLPGAARIPIRQQGRRPTRAQGAGVEIGRPGHDEVRSDSGRQIPDGLLTGTGCSSDQGWR